MFKSSLTKIVDQILIVSNKLHDDCRYDQKDAGLRLAQLKSLVEAMKLLINK